MDTDTGSSCDSSSSEQRTLGVGVFIKEERPDDSYVNEENCLEIKEENFDDSFEGRREIKREKVDDPYFVSLGGGDGRPPRVKEERLDSPEASESEENSREGRGVGDERYNVILFGSEDDRGVRRMREEMLERSCDASDIQFEARRGGEGSSCDSSDARFEARIPSVEGARREREGERGEPSRNRVEDEEKKDKEREEKGDKKEEGRRTPGADLFCNYDHFLFPLIHAKPTQADIIRARENLKALQALSLIKNAQALAESARALAESSTQAMAKNNSSSLPMPPIPMTTIHAFPKSVAQSSGLTTKTSAVPTKASATQDGPPRKSIECQECGKVFQDRTALGRHLKTHTGEKPHKCTYCGKCFARNTHLVIHTRIHTKEKPFSCEICGKAFSYKTTLENHVRIHTKEKPYVCEICSKAFSRQFTLATHMRTHTQEKPYICDECGRAFSQKNQLVTHKRTHTQEKPYPCTICSRAFSSKGRQVTHMRTHTKERPFVCEVCCKDFSDKRHLVTHRRIHTKEKPYSCQVCSKKFSDSSNLARHVRIHSRD